MHAQFAHEQTYFACIASGAGYVAGDRCKLHGEVQVDGRGQRALRQWRASMNACMHNSPMNSLPSHASSVEQVTSPEIFANCTGKCECVEVASAH